MYSLRAIANELQLTAQGSGFYGNALRVAKDLSFLTAEDRSILDRYASGNQLAVDHLALQGIANKVLDESSREMSDKLTQAAKRLADSLIQAESDFKNGKVVSFEYSRIREATLAEGLVIMAARMGCDLNGFIGNNPPRHRQPIQIDSRGEFCIYAMNESGFGAEFAEALNQSNGARTGIATTNMIDPMGRWCMLNHFAAENMVKNYAGKLLHNGVAEAAAPAM